MCTARSVSRRTNSTIKRQRYLSATAVVTRKTFIVDRALTTPLVRALPLSAFIADVLNFTSRLAALTSMRQQSAGHNSQSRTNNGSLGVTSDNNFECTSSSRYAQYDRSSCHFRIWSLRLLHSMKSTMHRVLIVLTAVFTNSNAKFQFTAGLGPEWDCAVCVKQLPTQVSP